MALELGLSIGLYILVCVLLPVVAYIIVEILKADPCNLGICPQQYQPKKAAEKTVVSVYISMEQTLVSQK